MVVKLMVVMSAVVRMISCVRSGDGNKTVGGKLKRFAHLLGFILLSILACVHFEVTISIPPHENVRTMTSTLTSGNPTTHAAPSRPASW